MQLNILGTGEHYQHLFSTTTTFGSPATVSFDVLSTPITDE